MTNSAEPLLRISQLKKNFPPSVKALTQVELTVRAGEVHALVGENGAGKSTLSKIIAGLERADDGEMFLNGKLYQPHSRSEAEGCGVRIVLQELNLLPTLTIAENIYIDRMPHRFGMINYPQLKTQAREAMSRVGLSDLAPERRVETLGTGQRQLVEIAAGLSRRCELLILDEPTAALTGAEAELLFNRIEELKKDGVAVIYISHRMEEIRRIADVVTVLRDGATVGTLEAKLMRTKEIISLMIGREVEEVGTEEARTEPVRHRGEPLLRVEHLFRGEEVKDVSFTAYAGEILGLAGLMGSGRTEVLRAVFGADLPERGQIFLRHSDTPASIKSPSDAVESGIALLTEDRKGQGLLLPLPISENVTLARLKALSLFGGGWLDFAKETTVTESYAKALQIRCSSVGQRVEELSGGNQQKVVIAKWLYRDCDVLLFDEPTRGIDVGAKFEIYKLLNDLAGRGKALVVVSSDLTELMTISDRIGVMSAGRLVGFFDKEEFAQDVIMAAALSGYTSAREAAPMETSLSS